MCICVNQVECICMCCMYCMVEYCVSVLAPLVVLSMSFSASLVLAPMFLVNMCSCSHSHFWSTRAHGPTHRFAEQPRETAMQPSETTQAQQLNEMLQEPSNYIREFVRELDFRK